VKKGEAAKLSAFSGTFRHMARTTSKRQKRATRHSELSQSLTNWADKYGVSDDPYVTALANALNERKNLAMWATLSPLEYLPFPKRFSPGTRLIDFVTLIRNTLIFAPVALTWSAVGMATSAFGKFVSQNQGSVVNFLQFWQNGYDILGSSWRLGHIAFLDFLLISTVIVLIVFLHFQHQRINARSQSLEIQVDTERMKLAIDIYEFLFEKRAISRETRRDEFANATQNLSASASTLRSLIKSFEKASKDGPTNKKILSELKKINKESNSFSSFGKNFKF
jgi:uncharacterized membrane protein